MKVVVVGAGVVGLSAGYELAKDGHSVTVIDAREPGQGSTVGSAAKIALAESAPIPAPGMVLQGIRWMLDPSSPLYIRPSLAPDFVRFMFAMARHCNRSDYRRGLEANLTFGSSCLDVLDEWRSEGLTFEEHRRGVLLAYEESSTFKERLSHGDVYARFGYTPRVLDEAAVRKFEPALSERIQHGVYYEQDRQIEPQSLVTALSKALLETGSKLSTHRTVTGFARHGDRVTTVLTQNGPLECDVLVLAAGAFSGPLTRLLGGHLPIRPGKGYSIDYADSPTRLRVPLTLVDAHVAVSPLDGGLRIGGTMELGGFDVKIRRRRIAAVKKSAAASFRDWDDLKKPAAPWAGLRAMTPDGVPVVGLIPGWSNAIVASGHAMLGLTLAPPTAKAVRSLVRGDWDSWLHNALSPARF